MTIELLESAEAAARRAAEVIAAEARDAVAARGRFLLAVSGGGAPRRMFQLLAKESVPWKLVHVFQVDERIVPPGSPDRNATHLQEGLIARVAITPDRFHPMPVDEPDLEAAANWYQATLTGIAGDPPVLDLVHLGLGADGHTASLVPDDPVLDVVAAAVSVTGSYKGHRRMTLTLPALNRARRILWLITGAGKGPALARLRERDRRIPAGRVRGDRALVLADVSSARGPGRHSQP